MKKTILTVFLLAGLILQNEISAQSNSRCLANIESRITALKAAGDTDFSIGKIYKIMDDFAYGKIDKISGDPLKQKAFARVFETMSELIDLTGDGMTGLGLRGYVRLAGGIIRSSVDRDFFEEFLRVFGGREDLDIVGINDVMEQLETTGEWLSQGVWRSPGGYEFRTGALEGHRILHVLTHKIEGYIPPNGFDKPIHSVFNVARERILPLIDETSTIPRNLWRQAFKDDAVTLIPNGFIVPMGRVIGTNGERRMFLLFHDTGPGVLQAAHPIM